MSTGLKKYSQYKDSGVEWLGQIPAHWEFIKLKYCSDIFNGNSLNDNLKNKFQSFEEEGLAYISSKDINLNTSEINYESGLRIPFNEKKYKIAPKNSILLCIEGGSAGRKIAFTNQNVCFVNKLACLHSKKNMISKYLFYTSRASIFTEQFFLALTGLIGGVSISNISNFVVPLPPLEEQQAIADFLDRKTQQIERVIAQKEKMIALLKERKQIIIQQAVTKGLNPDVPLKDSGVEWLGEIPAHWETIKTKYCGKIKSGDSLTATMQNQNGSFEVWGGNGFMGYHDSFNVYENILIIGRVGAQCGNIKITEKPIFVTDNALIFKVNKKIYTLFLLYCLKARDLNRLNESNAQPLITATKVYDTIIVNPPIEEQKQIVDFIEAQSAKIDNAINLQQQQIERLRELKTSLIDSAVTGKIKVY
ncbi:restriction endonuclease subunit S [Ornithobacterium rhinotracheale]